MERDIVIEEVIKHLKDGGPRDISSIIHDLYGYTEESLRMAEEITAILLGNDIIEITFNQFNNSVYKLSKKGIVVIEGSGYQEFLMRQNKTIKVKNRREEVIFIIAVIGAALALGNWIKDIIILILDHK